MRTLPIVFDHYVRNSSDEIRVVHKGNFLYNFLAMLIETEGTSLCYKVHPYNIFCYLPLLALTGYGNVKRFEPSAITYPVTKLADFVT